MTIHTVVVITQDARFRAALREGLESEGGVRALTASSFDEARRTAWGREPALIVLEESGLAPAEGAVLRASAESFEAQVALLAGIAPVIVVAAAERQGEIPALLAAGAADFVARAGDFLPCVLAIAGLRLQRREQEAAAGVAAVLEDFGDVLRHELNNPLTGILGNAELLLVETQRRKDGRLPEGAVARLQTITDLAVRLRETVRRLSQRWMEKHANARSA